MPEYTKSLSKQIKMMKNLTDNIGRILWQEIRHDCASPGRDET